MRGMTKNTNKHMIAKTNKLGINNSIYVILRSFQSNRGELEDACDNTVW